MGGHGLTPLVSFEDVLAALFPEASVAQRCVARLFEGLRPRTGEERDTYEQLLGRPWGPDLGPQRIIVMLFGAGSGKSTIASLYAYYRARTANRDGLRPGERLSVPIVAPEKQLARIVLDYIGGLATALPDDGAEVQIEHVHWPDGVSADIYAATQGGRSVRGRRFPLVILDEVAYFRDSSYKVNDSEIVNAVLPRLRPDGQLIALTTPARRRGWVHDMYVQNYAVTSPHALVLRGSTALLNPQAAHAVELLGDDVHRRELMAEWVDEQGALAEVSWIRAALGAPQTAGPVNRRRGALDLAGEGTDLTALAIGRPDNRGGVVVEQVHAWKTQPMEATAEAIGRICGRVGLRELDADPYAFAAAQALFLRYGLTLKKRTITAINKGAMWARVRNLLQSGALMLPRDPDLGHELEAIELHAGPQGTVTVMLPRTSAGHCDRAQAVALLCDVLAEDQWRGARPIGWRPPKQRDPEEDLPWP